MNKFRTVLFVFAFLLLPVNLIAQDKIISKSKNVCVIRITREAQGSYDLSWNQAIDAISAASKNAQFEDGWIYSPKNHRLYDVGCSNPNTDDGVYMDLKFFDNNNSLLSGDVAVEIHNHPGTSGGFLDFYPPSFDDMISYYHFLKKFGKEYHSSLRSIIFDKCGYWEVKLNSNFNPATLSERGLGSSGTHSRKEMINKYIKAISAYGVNLTYTERA